MTDDGESDMPRPALTSSPSLLAFLGISLAAVTPVSAQPSFPATDVSNRASIIKTANIEYA